MTNGDTSGDDPRDTDLEAELRRKEQQLQVVRERYEQLIDRRSRLRREAGPDDQFVWTGRSRVVTPESESGRSAEMAGARAEIAGGKVETAGARAEIAGGKVETAGARAETAGVQADGGTAYEAPEPGWLGRLFERLMG